MFSLNKEEPSKKQAFDQDMVTPLHDEEMAYIHEPVMYCLCFRFNWMLTTAA